MGLVDQPCLVGTNFFDTHFGSVAVDHTAGEAAEHVGAILVGDFLLGLLHISHCLCDFESRLPHQTYANERMHLRGGVSWCQDAGSRLGGVEMVEHKHHWRVYLTIHKLVGLEGVVIRRRRPSNSLVTICGAD